jgi:Zn-dependent protease
MRLFGFPVHVRPGFIMFMLLVVMINGPESGLWLAGAIAVFTLAHELGHAFAARTTGARAEIALDFLAGYASFQPTRPLRRAERAAIALAGPATQILLGVAVLAVLGVNPVLRADVEQSAATLAIWWAGPVLGLFNLIPVLPLDGGTIAAEGIDRLAPGRGRALMSRLSLPLTVAALVALLVAERGRPFVPFVAILLVFQLQAVSAERQRDPAVRARELARAQEVASRAEAQLWLTGRDGPMAPGQVPSPWWRAHQARSAGDVERARELLVASLTGTDEGWWWPPEAAPTSALASLVELLPRPFPFGNRTGEHVLVDVLRRIGHHEAAARYGAESFTRSPSVTTAVGVACSVAALGDHDLAVRWLQTAQAAQAPGVGSLAALVQAAPELSAVRSRPDVRALLG